MISLIIPFRVQDQERVDCLNDVLNQYAKLPITYEIIVVEQDRVPRLNIQPRSNVKVIFAYNGGLFNRSWAFNVGVSNATYDLVGCCDADIIMSTPDFVDAVNKLAEYEAVNPYHKIVDLTQAVTEKYRNQNNNIFLSLEMSGKERAGTNFAGGILLITKQSFYRINGWPEEIRGWGTEDNIMALKIERHLSHTTMPYVACHLYHKPGVASDHCYHEVNKAILRSYQSGKNVVATRIGDRKRFTGIRGRLNELLFLLKHRRLVSSHFHYRIIHAPQRDVAAILKALALNPFSLRLLIDAFRHLTRRNYAS